MLAFGLIGLISIFSIFTKIDNLKHLAIFCGLCLVALLVAEIAPDYLFQRYYLMCALSHYLIHLRISSNKNITGLNYSLYINNVRFIYLNLFGLLANWLYISPTYYNVSCIIIYSIILLSVLREAGQNGFRIAGIHSLVLRTSRHLRNSISEFKRSEAKT